MNKDNILFIEQPTPWGGLMDVRQLTLRDLRLHLRARNVENTSGTKLELAEKLKAILQEEHRIVWDKHQNNVSRAELRLKALIRTAKEEDQTFNVSLVNGWIKSSESKGAWNWSIDKRSLAYRVAQARKKHEIGVRSQQRKIPILAKSKKVQQVHKVNPLLTGVKSDHTCTYRSEFDGENYYCVNRRVVATDGNEQRTCAFHVSNCTNTIHHQQDNSTRVKKPNELGLCLECYRRIKRRQPFEFQKYKCPGTHIVRQERDLKLAQVREVNSKPIEKSNSIRFCKWKADAGNNITLKCTNKVLHDGKTTCGFHTTRCELQHPAENPKIIEPNIHGMCRSHYSAKTGFDPEIQMDQWNTEINHVMYPPGVVLDIKAPIEPRENSLRPIQKQKVMKETVKLLEDIDPLLDIDVLAYLKVITAKIKTGMYSKNMHSAFKKAMKRIGADEMQKTFAEHKKKAQRLFLGKYWSTTIQRVYRGYRGRLKCNHMRMTKRGHLRCQLVVMIQALHRGNVGRFHALQHSIQVHNAVVVFQKLVRGFNSRRETKQLKSTMDIQRCIRGYLCRLEISSKVLLAEFRARRVDQMWAQMTLIRYLRQYIKRFRKYKRLRLQEKQEQAATDIQHVFRAYTRLCRSKITALRMALCHRSATLIQRAIRQRMQFRQQILELLRREKAALKIESVWRSFRCRIRLMMENEALEKAWQYLGSNQDKYGYLLPKTTYTNPIATYPATSFWVDKGARRLADLMDGMKKGKPITNQQIHEENRGTPQEKKDLWTVVPFLAFDPHGSGMVKRHEFRQGLLKMGYQMSNDQIEAILTRWADNRGHVNYLAFMDFVSQEVYCCVLHRAWACPSCVCYGACVKCKCDCFSKSSDSKTQRTMCSCGHYVAMHRLVPRTFSSPASSILPKQSLDRMLIPSLPQSMSPDTKGVPIENSKLTMSYSTQDLGIRAQTAPHKNNKRTRLEFKPSINATPAQNSLAFQKLGAKIISDISLESKAIVANMSSGFKPVQNTESDNKLAIKAIQAHPEQLGRLLLSSAARPHTSTHLKRDRKQFAERLVEAKKRGKELQVDLSWTTLEEFSKSFTVRDPVPLIINDQLRMETTIAPLYVDMLLALSSEECGLLEDSSAFISYVFQSFAFIDRHWKKLVYDMRTGTLDRHIDIPSRTRKAVEKLLKPNPTRAATFDKCMQQLGFYKSASELQPEFSAPRNSNHRHKEKVSQILSARIPMNPQQSKVQIGSKTVDDMDGRETTKTLNKINHKDTYEFAKRPRITPVKILERNSRNSRQYVCSFPGCGRVFSNRRIAEKHGLNDHKGKFRLANEMILIDEKMHAFWPKKAPWIPNSKSRKTLHNPKEESRLAREEFVHAFPQRCSRNGCPLRFKTEKEMNAHVQAVHLRDEELKELIGPVENISNLQFRNSLQQSPPSSLPLGINIPCCSTHWILLRPRCQECEFLLKSKIPVCPLEFYESVRIEQKLSFSVTKPAAAHIVDTQGNQCLGHVRGLFTDKVGRAFIAYTKYQFASDITPPLPENYDREYQLTEDKSSVLIRPMSSIVGLSFVIRCEKREFHRRKRQGELPVIHQEYGNDASLLKPGNYFVYEEEESESLSVGAYIPHRRRINGTF